MEVIQFNFRSFFRLAFHQLVKLGKCMSARGVYLAWTKREDPEMIMVKVPKNIEVPYGPHNIWSVVHNYYINYIGLWPQKPFVFWPNNFFFLVWVLNSSINNFYKRIIVFLLSIWVIWVKVYRYLFKSDILKNGNFFCR